MTIGIWDVGLVIGVSALSTALAYLHAPKWKALMLALPIPFTFATMAVGKPVGIAAVVGSVVMLAYTHAVRLLHYNARLPIVPSIVISAAGYCLVSFCLVQILPTDETSFWIAMAAAFAVALAFYFGLPYRDEPGHRSPLPLHIKVPIIFAVIMFLVVVKKWLGGFMTMFPMVGVIASYEARHSLWTIGRQIPLIMVAFGPMLAACHVTQVYLGWPLPATLAAGWVAYLASVIPLLLRRWRETGVPEELEDERVADSA